MTLRHMTLRSTACDGNVSYGRRLLNYNGDLGWPGRVQGEGRNETIPLLPLPQETEGIKTCRAIIIRIRRRVRVVLKDGFLPLPPLPLGEGRGEGNR